MSPFSFIAVAVVLGGIIFSVSRRVSFSLVMAAVIAVVFVVKVVESPLVISPLTLDLGFQPVHLTSLERSYTLFTSMFLHATFLHLIFNMMALIFIGPLLEERIGTLRFAAVYLASGIIGALAFGIIHINETAIVIGASGAISGILGAFAALYPREKISMLYVLIPLPPMRIPYLVALIIVIETLFALDPRSHTAQEAHLAGLAGGLFFGPLVMRIGPHPEKERYLILTGLRQLAVNDDLRAILGRIEDESLEDVRRAWLERFVHKARCPECGGPLRVRGRGIYSDCGWSVKIRAKL
ncbi:MAG: rhomboid family intramembrane serine protease [Thermoplasmata archaeon]